MMFLVLIIVSLSVVQCNCLSINGKEYHMNHMCVDGVSKRVIYAVEYPRLPWVARSRYNKTYLKTGWDTFDVETNEEINDNEQAFLAGYLEGVETHTAIFHHYHNIMSGLCGGNESRTCAAVDKYFTTNTAWVKDMVAKHAASDIYWQQVNLYYLQLAGLSLGYNSVAPSDQKLTGRDIMWLNFMFDADDLKSAMTGETNKSLRGFSHCSVLIKLLQGNSDIVAGHNSWTGYEMMIRIVKRYTLGFQNMAGQSMSFTSYPAALQSGDDFCIISSGLVAIETTNDVNNASLWADVKPVGQVLEVVRSTVAHRLANSGQAWGKIFARYNSGTYNNQWMILDLNMFSPGKVRPGLLWIVEQAPGYVYAADQTEIIRQQGYWASYNRPFYRDIFNLMGDQVLVDKYGDFFTYDKNPRALIFKRDQGSVVDVATLLRLMRSNDYQRDPLSRCDCQPPYNAFNAIASRSDLNPENGTYPFPALGHRPYGAIDAKATSYHLAKDLSMVLVAGPTTGTQLPPFRWSYSDFNDIVSHQGQPDLLLFDPVLITWPNQGRASQRWRG